MVSYELCTFAVTPETMRRRFTIKTLFCDITNSIFLVSQNIKLIFQKKSIL